MPGVRLVNGEWEHDPAGPGVIRTIISAASAAVTAAVKGKGPGGGK
jgi:hypothetical protein